LRKRVVRLPVLAIAGLAVLLTDPLHAAAEPQPGVVPAPAEGAVPSAAPATTVTPDNWTLTVSADDETQVAGPPLTTALSSREYVVGGVFSASMLGPDGQTVSKGSLEVGYQIGCGIDMSTSLGVSLTASAGLTPSLGPDVLDGGIFPSLLMPFGGGVTVGLKPGLITLAPVVRKEFDGADPFVSVASFRVTIDGCVGQSFIRSYATLIRSTNVSDSVLSYTGVTKSV